MWQVELVLPLQARWHKAASQEVVSTSEHESRLLGSSERDEHVGLQSICTALLHIPTFKKTNKQDLTIQSRLPLLLLVSGYAQ